MYFILFSHMFLSISRKALQRAKLRRLTTPTRKAASAYNVTIQGLQCVNENSSYFRSGKPMSHVQHDVQRLRRERFSRPFSTASSKKHAYSSDSFNINNTSVTPHAHYTAAKASRHSERCDLAGRSALLVLWPVMYCTTAFLAFCCSVTISISASLSTSLSASFSVVNSSKGMASAFSRICLNR